MSIVPEILQKAKGSVRRTTRTVLVGGLSIGGDAPIRVQSMTKTDTRDIPATVDQIHRLTHAGCELVRVAVPDMRAAKCLSRIREQISIPLVADIHFDWRLALEALDQGVDKIRLNPGNIREKSKIVAIVRRARDQGVPIRVGVNSGSLDPEVRRVLGAGPEALVESARREIGILEEEGFGEIVVSLKGTHIPLTIAAYKMLAGLVEYPFHIGITEAGCLLAGSIRSAVGLGTLLYMGLGDTMRVSLTADPVEEVRVAYEILKTLELRSRGPTVISCPTCGRTRIDVKGIAEIVEEKVAGIREPILVAVMGCVVNGPGEASAADVGIAGGRGAGVIFREGKIVRRVKEESLVQELLGELESVLAEREKDRERRLEKE